MGFDRDKEKKLRESMDYDSNGRLTAIANKAAAIDAPILIIGLGGTGVAATIKVKKIIYDRIQSERKDNGEIMDKPKNIEYLVLDTDMSSADASAGGIHFSDIMEESLIYTSGDIQKKIQSDALPHYINSWIDKNIDVKEVINGAGAVRQLGRFMLFDNLQEVLGVLETKIRRVTASYNNKIPLYVFILAGISGGTGSGTFLDVPYMVRGVAKGVDDMRIVNRIGILFLPDVNLGTPGLTTTKKENLKKNGFAALKELDYLMNVNTTGDCFEQEYGRLKIGPKASGDMPPYETCILMSAKDKNGITQMNPYDYTLAVAAETVIGFIASEKNKDVQHFSITSFLSNYADDCSTFMNMLGENIRPVHYSYAVAGGSSAVLPLDDIMSYMAFLAFKEVNGQWDRIPEVDEVNAVMASFGLDTARLEQTLCLNAPRINGLQRHTYELIKQAPQMIIAEFDGNLEQRKKYMRDKTQEMLADMTARVQANDNPIDEIFRDVERGPIFAQRLLFTSSDNWCVIKGIMEMKRWFMTNAPSPQIIDSYKKQADSKMNELLQSQPFLPRSKRKLREELIKALNDYYDTLFKQVSYEILMRQCEQYYDIFMARNNEIYSCIAEMLKTLIELFQKFSSIRTETRETKNGNLTTLNWSMVEIPIFIEELEKKMRGNEELNIDLHAFITDFYSYLFNNVEIWNGKKRADIVERVNYFISNAFDKVLNKSMDFYVEFIASALDTTVPEYSQKICKDLEERSDIKFPVCATYNPVVENPGYSFVSVPINAGAIEKEIQNRVKNRSIIKESEIKDRLFMMNFMDAVPLYAYSDLAACHDAYANLMGNKAGLHLYEGTQINWRELPSPLPQSEWEGGHYIESEAKDNQAWMEIFDKAVKYRYIRLEEKNGRAFYICYWGELVNPERILKENWVDLQGEMETNAVLACIKEISKEKDNDKRLKFHKSLFAGRNKVLEDGTREVDEEFAKYIFIKMVMVRSKIKQMVADHEKCQEILEKLSPFLSRKEVLMYYVKSLYTESLTKKRGEYVYIDRTKATQPFCRLKGEQNDYPDYYLFNYFFGQWMGDGKKEIEDIVKVSDNLEAEKSKDDESYNEMKEKLQDYVGNLKTVISELNEEWRNVDNGLAIMNTYKEIYKVAETQYKGM